MLACSAGRWGLKSRIVADEERVEDGSNCDRTVEVYPSGGVWGNKRREVVTFGFPLVVTRAPCCIVTWSNSVDFSAVAAFSLRLGLRARCVTWPPGLD